MPEHLPFQVAQKVAEENGLRQIVILAWDGDRTHVVSYGGSAEDSDVAAQDGNVIKSVLGWPDKHQTESPKVEALRLQIQELKLELEMYRSDRGF